MSNTLDRGNLNSSFDPHFGSLKDMLRKLQPRQDDADDDNAVFLKGVHFAIAAAGESLGEDARQKLAEAVKAKLES